MRVGPATEGNGDGIVLVFGGRRGCGGGAGTMIMAGMAVATDMFVGWWVKIWSCRGGSWCRRRT
jgi:hypothetical protein